MKIIAQYSFNRGAGFIKRYFKNELKEIKKIVSQVNANKCQTKVSKEKTMKGRKLYSPIKLNEEFKKLFKKRRWETIRIPMETYIPELKVKHKGFREMDMVKNKLGIEVQLGKYAFMVYNVAAKMTIFKNQKIIKAGVEIVPMKSLASKMSTGVSYFEQIKSDLEYRGISNIDTPVLIIGIDA